MRDTEDPEAKAERWAMDRGFGALSLAPDPKSSMYSGGALHNYMHLIPTPAPMLQSEPGSLLRDQAPESPNDYLSLHCLPNRRNNQPCNYVFQYVLACIHVHACMHGCMDGWMAGWMDGWLDGWMDGWMDAWMDGWMDGRMDVGIGMNACMHGWAGTRVPLRGLNQ